MSYGELLDRAKAIHPSPRTYRRTLAKHFGPAVSAADIVAELERFVTVPSYAAEAITRFFDETTA